MINLENQQNPKVKKAKSNGQSTKDSICKKKTQSNRNTGISKHFLIITLNVNELNSPIKRHRLSDWTKTKIQQSVVYKKHTLQPKHTHKLNLTGWKKDLPGMWKLKASRSSYSHIRQSRFYIKVSQKR
jgi:hypothetical protein